MKKLFYLFLLVTIFNENVEAQWDSLGIVAGQMYQHFGYIIIKSPEVAYKIDNEWGGETPTSMWTQSTILKSVDYWDSWTQIYEIGGSFPDWESITSCQFNNDSVGYITKETSYYSLLQTSDGGSQWVPILPSCAPDLVFSFPRADFGYFFSHYYVSGDNFYGLNLYNQGQFSKQDTISTSTMDIQSLDFINDSTGFAFCGPSSSVVYQTHDYGHTWNIPVGSIGDVKKIVFPSQSKGYLLNSLNHLYSSTDMGGTWSFVTPIPMDTISDIFFLNPEMGWVSGPNGKILKTINGGATWENVPTPTTDEIFEIRYFTETTGYFLTRKLYDNGQTILVYLYRTQNGPWGVEEQENANPIRIIQNPAISILRLSLKSPSQPISSMEIISSNGKIVYNFDRFVNEIDISSFLSGLYILKYISRDKIFSEKFLITRNGF